MFSSIRRSGKKTYFGPSSALAVLMAVLCIILTFNALAVAQDAAQPRKFKSPGKAMAALVEAANNNNTKELLAIFGPNGSEIISSGDAVADLAGRRRFVTAAREAIKFSNLDSKTVLAVIGKDEWCFPVPLVKSGLGWIFSTEEGKHEILNRRIGRNELNAIRVAQEYVKAQREYAGKDRTGDGIQYAQRFISKKGKKDGLYWDAGAAEEPSPLGPLIARAEEEGYPVNKADKKHTPYHGYYYKILKGQEGTIAGGAVDYIVNGKMVAGFGMLAYPANYGVSGIMTFVVNQQGVVYEKDLGTQTEALAKAITKYAPDNTWRKSELPSTVSTQQEKQ